MLLPAVLFILGCFFIFYQDNFLSFVFSLITPVLIILNLIIGLYWIITKNKFFLLSLFCIVLYFLCFDSFFQINSFDKDNLNVEVSDSNTLSLLTYNTSGFKNTESGIPELDDKIANFIISKDVDFFCLQEFSAIKYIFFKKKYPYFFKTNLAAGHDKSVMAIFSKYPIVDKGYISFPDTTNGAMYIDINFNENIIRVYNLHFQSFKIRRSFYDLSEVNGYSSLISTITKAEKMRKEQVVIIKKHIDSFKGKVILCGDFNSTQFTSTYHKLKNSKKDSFLEKGFGFGRSYSVFNYPFRVDYVLVDNSFEVLSHKNFDIKLSDHEPIMVELKIN